MRKNILDAVAVIAFCLTALSACMNNNTDIPMDSPNIMYEDPFDGDGDFYESDTTRICDSAFVVYDRKYDVTTLVIEGLLDKKSMKACEEMIVDEEQIDHILICSFRYDLLFIKQADELTEFMSTYRNNIMEESNSFMFIR